MSTAYISAFDNVDYGGFGTGAQCFDGVCSQDRADVPVTTDWPAAPHLTVENATRYVVVYLTAPGLIYAGPGPVVPARAAAYPAGWWPMAVKTSDIVAIRDL